MKDEIQIDTETNEEQSDNNDFFGKKTSVRRVVKTRNDTYEVESSTTTMSEYWTTEQLILVDSGTHMNETYGSLEALHNDLDDQILKTFTGEGEDGESEVVEEVRVEDPEHTLDVVDIPAGYTQMFNNLSRSLSSEENRGLSHAAYILSQAMNPGVFKVTVQSNRYDDSEVYCVKFVMNEDELSGDHAPSGRNRRYKEEGL